MVVELRRRSSVGTQADCKNLRSTRVEGVGEDLCLGFRVNATRPPRNGRERVVGELVAREKAQPCVA